MLHARLPRLAHQLHHHHHHHQCHRQLSSIISSSLLTFSPAVARALRDGAPIVALESTIVAHGMPFPANLETALAVEADVRAFGAVPATVALSNGRLVVGADAALLEALARGGAGVRKTSRRDIASVLASGGLGATTVAGTMLAASAAGVRVFATGGVGGVHRGGELSMDVSADLYELGRTRVCVVCAGVKSILDIRRTLELLETLGVPVWALGTDLFPAFYAPSAGVPAPERVDDLTLVAARLRIADSLLLGNGELLAVPNPEPAGDGAAVAVAIETALIEAQAAQISGAASTPFLLKRVAELTSGASLRANVALVRNNSKVAARLAVAYAANTAGKNTSKRSFSTASQQHQRPFSNGLSPNGPILCIGGAVLDIIARPTSRAYVPGASNPGIVTQTAGGVARNISEVIARLWGSSSSSSSSSSSGGESDVRLLTSIGDDAAGVTVSTACTDAGVQLVRINGGGGRRKKMKSLQMVLPRYAQQLILHF